MKPRTVYKFNKLNEEEFRKDLQQFSKEKYFNSRKKSISMGYSEKRTVNKNWEMFNTEIKSLIDKHVPTCKFNPKFDLPWMTKKVKRTIRKKQRKYNNARKHNNTNNWAQFKKFRKMTSELIKKSRDEYVNNVIGKSLENNESKPFWNYTKSLKREPTGVQALKG